MLKVFAYDNATNEVVINEPEILLIKEFADLWSNDRNKCKEDTKGVKKLLARKELIYIYLAIDWRSPISKDTAQNRHETALVSSGLTDKEFDDPVFRAACNKYNLMQEASSTCGKLVRTYMDNIHKMNEFIKSIDYSERDELTGKPIFKIEDTLKLMTMINKAVEGLQELELKFKAEQQETELRGGKEPGMFD